MLQQTEAARCSRQRLCRCDDVSPLYELAEARVCLSKPGSVGALRTRAVVLCVVQGGNVPVWATRSSSKANRVRRMWQAGRVLLIRRRRARGALPCTWTLVACLQDVISTPVKHGVIPKSTLDLA